MRIVRERPSAVGSMIVSAVLAACGSPPPAPPPASTLAALPSAAPATTSTTTTTLPPPPPVWRAARWGMTRREVLAAFPGEAQRLAQPADFGPQVGGSSDVAIPAYEADGRKFRVLFGFASDALDRVHLTAVNPGSTACADVEKQLVETHSDPSDRSTDETTLKVMQTVWKRPDQTITLICTERRSLGYRSLALDYAAPSTAGPAAAP